MEQMRVATGFSSELFAGAAVDFIKSRGQDAKPCLLSVAFPSPHDRRMAPPRLAAVCDPSRIELPPNFMPSHPFDNGEMKVRDELLAGFPCTEAEARKHIAAYYAMVSEVDHQIGRILDALERSPRRRPTHIVFAGDNGLAVGQHGLMGQQNLCDPSWRVPLIIAGPRADGGRRCHSLCYLMDLCPTVRRFAGAALPGGMEAKELNPALRDEKTVVRRPVVAAYRDCQRALRTDRWKRILYNVNGAKTTRLFDLEKDPWEVTNLAEKEPKLAAELKNDLQAQLKAMGDETVLDAPKWAF